MSLLPPLVRIPCRDAVVSSRRKAGQGGGRKRNANESKSLFSLDPFPIVHTLDIYCRGIKDAISAWKMASIWKLETLRSKRRNEEGGRNERGEEKNWKESDTCGILGSSLFGHVQGVEELETRLRKLDGAEVVASFNQQRLKGKWTTEFSSMTRADIAPILPFRMISSRSR